MALTNKQKAIIDESWTGEPVKAEFIDAVAWKLKEFSKKEQQKQIAAAMSVVEKVGMAAFIGGLTGFMVNFYNVKAEHIVLANEHLEVMFFAKGAVVGAIAGALFKLGSFLFQKMAIPPRLQAIGEAAGGNFILGNTTYNKTQERKND